MKDFLRGFVIVFFVGSVLIGAFLFFPEEIITKKSIALIGFGGADSVPEEKTVEQRIAEARERASKIKGLYMTADVANDSGVGATRLREHIISLAEKTEINGIVIDTKEVCGPDYDEKRLRQLVQELKEKGIWTIARIVVFKDASQIEAHSEWYLTRETPKSVGEECFRKRHLRADAPVDTTAKNTILWQDKRGGYWLDPDSPEVHEYLLSFSKQMIDVGFDELQFDYIRFPSDGDVWEARYPFWDGKTPKYAVLKSFFELLRDNLQAHKPEIILSADLFGYVAAQREDKTIGQRLDDISASFDFVSFMVYPSHYYSGLYFPADLSRGLPEVNYTFSEARTNSDVVVGRSLGFARDFLDGKIASSSSVSTTTIGAFRAPASVKLRPWLEDFFHEEDKAAGRPYGAQKVRMQIEAAERVEDHGWLLWNAANVYTDEALKKDQISGIVVPSPE